jgi:hypothetical protein
VGRGEREQEICEESRVEREISRREKSVLQLSGSRKNWEISLFWTCKKLLARFSLQADK